MIAQGSPVLGILVVIVLGIIVAAGIWLRVVQALLGGHNPAPKPPVSMPPVAQSPVRIPPRILPALDPELPYIRTAQVMSRAELAFAQVLHDVVPTEVTIFPQVRLAGLVHVAPSFRRVYTHFNRIQAKTVDFVLCDAATTAPLLVIELDDRSHDRPDRQQRDAFVDAVLQAAGLPILHVRWQRSYDARQLAACICSVSDGAIVDRFAAQPVYTSPSVASIPVPTLALMMSAAPPPVRTPPIAAPLAQAGGQPAYAASFVCGTCEHPITRATVYCPNCGKRLA